LPYATKHKHSQQELLEQQDRDPEQQAKPEIQFGVKGGQQA
jgi:hypothetical protein